ncbi:MAG: cyclic nucleotide-binding/CBS domain-containing protein, partial [Desulfobacterales bacterium]|nr:cyclic nucleotide-binding/CBS domain-containing protein [Desulfobacterales bacterium]
PSEVFGGITILLNGGTSLRTVVVERDCRGFAIPSEIFQDLCTRFKSFHAYFLENFSKHIFDDSIKSIIETGQAQTFLAGVDPFSFLPEEEIEQLSTELEMVRFSRDTVLFVQGRSRVGYLYILQAGSAERYYEEGNKKNMRGILSRGDLYGGISMLLNDGVSVRTLQVHAKSYFYLLPRQVFMDICKRHKAFTEYFTDTFGKMMLDRSYAAIISQTMQPGEEGLQFFSLPVSDICTKKPIFMDADATIKAAAEKMSRKKISSLFIRSADDNCVGVVTEKDLTKKVIAAGRDISRPISHVMSSPVQTVSERALVFEALITMMQKDIRHLAVTDPDEKVVGILSNRDLLTSQGHTPLFLLREISASNAMEEITGMHKRLPGLIRSLISSGAKAKNLARFITTVSDTILEKVMKFTLDELGPPPARFVFMTLGSEGRKEQTLKTDQDNAIIFEDLPGEEAPAAREYFLRFGEKACTLLDQAGYDFCTGDVMAKNPKWCQPLSIWKEYFSSWIHAAEAEDLLQASIFFDFRHGYGDADLIASLRLHLLNSLGGWSGFFRHLTENALHFRPPIGFFGNFVVESKGENRDAFDIKSAMTPIVDFARIYALKNEIEETNTLERLRQLRIKNVLSVQEYEEIEKAYSFLLQLRFARQVFAAIDEKSKPDNYIKPKKLTHIEQRMLKEIFKRIEKFQTKLNFDFIGIA